MTTWVMAADSSRARLFSYESPKAELYELETLTNPEARLTEQGLVSDKGGAAFNASGSGSHGVNGENNAKRHDIDLFAKSISERLYKARTEKNFDKLYVVAAPSLLGMLRNHLHTEVANTVAGEIDKNLVIHSIADIRKHLPDYL